MPLDKDSAPNLHAALASLSEDSQDDASSQAADPPAAPPPPPAPAAPAAAPAGAAAPAPSDPPADAPATPGDPVAPAGEASAPTGGKPARRKAPVRALADAINAVNKAPKPDPVLGADGKPIDTAAAPGAPAAPAAGPDGKPVDGKATDAPAAEPGAEDEEPTLEQVLEGVNSERGKARLTRIFQERKQLKQDVEDFRAVVVSTGMTPQEFAETLQYGRLATSSNPADLEQALQMIEAQRADLYQRLGKEAPGVDLLAEFPDLQAKVKGLELTREAAVELASYRRRDKAEKARRDAETQSQRQQEEHIATVKKAADAMDAYLKTRENEADHPYKLRALIQHFQKPGVMQQFIETYRPEQWQHAVRMLYDTMVAAAPAPAPRDPQPITRSASAGLGRPAANPNEAPINRVASAMDRLGL